MSINARVDVKVGRRFLKGDNWVIESDYISPTAYLHAWEKDENLDKLEQDIKNKLDKDFVLDRDFFDEQLEDIYNEADDYDADHLFTIELVWGHDDFDSVEGFEKHLDDKNIRYITHESSDGKTIFIIDLDNSCSEFDYDRDATIDYIDDEDLFPSLGDTILVYTYLSDARIN